MTPSDPSARRLARRSRVAAGLAGLALAASPLTAATIVVGGGCTLVDAITAANTDSAAGSCPAGSGPDLLRLTGDVVLAAVDSSVDGDNGTPSITSEIVIEGEGFAIERDAAAPDFRLLHVAAEGSLELRDLTLRGGSALGFDGGGLLNRGFTRIDGSLLTENFTTQRGGAAANLGPTARLEIAATVLSLNEARSDGAAIANDEGTTTLQDSEIADNLVTQGIYNRSGLLEIERCEILGNPAGGVVNVGSASIRDSRISHNGTFDGNDGGGLVNSVEALIERTEISFNSARNGGGIINLGSSLELMIRQCRIRDNEASGSGGGLYSIGDFTLVDSEIADNRSYQDGGGIYAGTAGTVLASTVAGNVAETVVGGFGDGGGIRALGDLELASSTISGNLAGNAGGGIFVGGVLQLVHATFSGNSAAQGGALLDGTDPGSVVSGTLFANSASGGNCSGGGVLADGGGNYDDDGSCPADGVLTGLDAALMDNGGPSRTHALLAGSSAIDGNGACGLPADQRGYGRAGACDSGSFEFAGACELLLEGESALIVGQPGELDIHCATPLGVVRMAGGREPSPSFRLVPGCGVVLFDIGPRANNFGSVVADLEGDAFSVQVLEEAFAGMTVHFQAIDLATCTLTNVLAVDVLAPPVAFATGPPPASLR